MKSLIGLVGVLLVAIVIGAIFDFNVYPFGGSSNKTERKYLRDVQQSGVTQELAGKLAEKIAQEGGWANQKTAVEKLGADLKSCVDEAISIRLDSKSPTLNDQVTKKIVRNLAQSMVIDCIEKLAEG